MLFGRCVRRTFSFTLFPNIASILFVVFIFCNCLFFYTMFERKPLVGLDMKSNSALASYSELLQRYFYNINGEWRIKHFKNILKDSDILSTYDENKELNCSCLKHIESMDFVATGWTKASYRIKLQSNYLALKTVNINGHDISKCLTNSDSSLEECYTRASIKVLNEILRLRAIAHKNVIKVLGYCVPNYPDVQEGGHSVSLLTELGEPIDAIKLLQMSWEDRLRLSLGIVRLLHHLSTSALGTISLNDFRRQQFVIVDGELKLTDVDDIGFEDPQCSTEHCCISTPKSKSICVPCVLGRCLGFNEKSNILSAGRHFINYILPHGAPSTLHPLIDGIVAAFMEATWNTDKLLEKMNDLEDRFVTGKYRYLSATGNLNGYKVLNNSDLPATYDYRCKLTVTGHGCALSMFDAEEAAQVCNADSDCKAFVFTQVATWTGRKMTHFKNGFQNYVPQNGTTLYIKIA